MITYYIEVHHNDALLFTTSADTEAHAIEIYRALYERFDKGQGFSISVVQEERIGNFVDAEARWS